MSELIGNLKEIICRRCDNISLADTCELDKSECPVLATMPSPILAAVAEAVEGMPLYEAPEHLSTMMQGYAGAVARKQLELVVTELRKEG